MEIANSLVQHGIEVNSKNTCGCNALHCLCSNQHYFHFSFDRQGDLEVIRFLIDSGVKVDAQTKKGEIALMLSFRWERGDHLLNIIRLFAVD